MARHRSSIACVLTTLALAACSGGGDGASGPPLPRFEVGDPVDSPPGEWTYVPEPGSRCMNGTSSGFGVMRNPASDSLLIYFQGGNLCFDGPSCIGVANIDGFGPEKFDATVASLSSGMMSRTDPANPVRDWNMVMIPYCSGDLHIGNTDEGWVNPMLGDVPNQHFGYANTTLFLQRIVATFPDVRRVLVAGESAGGFGALGNFPQIHDAFAEVGDARMYLVDDSGPPMGDDYLKPCFQQLVRDSFGLDSIPLIRECRDCRGADGGGLGNIVPFILHRHPDARVSLLSTMADRTIRSFYGYGYWRTCDFPGPMPEEDYRAGLADIRSRLAAGTDNFRMYTVDDDFHTLSTRSLGSSTSGGMVGEFVRLQVDDDPAWADIAIPATP